VSKLNELGANVTVLDNYSRGRTRFDSSEIRIIRGHAAIERTLSYAFWDQDIVFNLAASVGGVYHNLVHHHDMFYDNVQVQVKPVKVAEALGVPVFVQVSSACVYDTDNNHPSVESEVGKAPHFANGGYGWSKRMGEEAVRWSQLGRGVIVRPSNVFGPGDYYDDKAHVIPALIRRAHQGEHGPYGKFRMYGELQTVREFIYVTDVADGMIAAAEHGEHGEAYNIGAGNLEENVITMKELAQKLVDHPKMHATDYMHIPGEAGDKFRWSDGSKSLVNLGWEAKVRFDVGLDLTIDDYLYQRAKEIET
jgi:GDP-L-fucose synthase